MISQIHRIMILTARFLNPNRTVQSDRVTHEPLTIMVLFILRSGLCQSSRKPFKPQSNCMVLKTVIRPLLAVPYLEGKKKKKGGCGSSVVTVESLGLISSSTKSSTIIRSCSTVSGVWILLLSVW